MNQETKPSHRAELPSPPAEEGQRIATFRRGPDEELRVNLMEYEGHPYLSLRVWGRGTDGSWWPRKGKGLSIRMGEIGGMMDALDGIRRRFGDRPQPARNERRYGAGRSGPGDFRDATARRFARESDGPSGPPFDPGSDHERPQMHRKHIRHEPTRFDAEALKSSTPTVDFDEFGGGSSAP